MPDGVEVCRDCRGKGWFDDSTYDRCGAMTMCGRCHGTGLKDEAVKKIIDNAFAPYLIPRPKE